MNNLLQKLLLSGSAATLLATMPALTASAQSVDSNTSTDNNGVEQIVVSASRISIAGYTQPTPVTVVGAADLDRNAYADIQDAVRELPQISSPPSSYSATSGAGGPGTAGEDLLNLRNLGVTRTLVLFDGQRVVGSNITGGVDISTLPSSIVQRVDVVTGGASATWGSDAVAGVVNFVLNKNFTGFKANVQVGDTSNDLSRGLTTQVDWGGDAFGDRAHFIVAAEMDYRPDMTPLVDEKWWRGAYWVSNPAYVAGNGQSQVIEANNVGYADATEGGIIVSSPKGTTAAANALKGIEFVGQGNTQSVNFGNVTNGTLSNGGSLGAYDTDVPQEVVGIPSTRYTLFSYGSYKLTDSIVASLQLNYGYNHTETRTAADIQTSIKINSDNPYIPASVQSAMAAGGITSFTLGKFFSDTFNLSDVTPGDYTPMADSGDGPVIIDNRRQLMRGVFTLEGAIGNDWSWNTYYEHSTTDILLSSRDNPANANLAAAEDAVTVTAANRGSSSYALGSIVCRSSLPGQAPVVVGGVTAQAGCIPLDVFGTNVGTPAAYSYVDAYNSDYQAPILNQDVVEGSMQGTLPWQLPAGPVAVAFGATYRKEAAVVKASVLGNQAGFANANGSNFPSSSYNTKEGFVEVNAPILKDSFVESLNADAAGRITDYSTSGLVETWKLGVNSQIDDSVKLRTTWSVDIRAPQLSELYTPSSFGGISVTDPRTNTTVQAVLDTTGNANLRPEVARTISGGLVLTPTFLPGLTLSADWYSIDLTGAITILNQNTITNQCNPALASTIHPGTNGNPNDPLCAALTFNGPNGALSQVTVAPLNAASQTTSGLDLQADYAFDFLEGSLALSTVANLNDENTSNVPGVGKNDIAGAIGNGGTPKWKGIVAANYIAGPYSFTVQSRWFGSGIQTNTANTGPQATLGTANYYPSDLFEIPFVAYLDLRGSYRWNTGIEIYGAIDNVTDVPPPLVPPLSSLIKAQGGLTGTNPAIYDLLGRVFRAGIRFTY